MSTHQQYIGYWSLNESGRCQHAPFVAQLVTILFRPSTKNQFEQSNQWSLLLFRNLYAESCFIIASFFKFQPVCSFILLYHLIRFGPFSIIVRRFLLNIIIDSYWSWKRASYSCIVSLYSFILTRVLSHNLLLSISPLFGIELSWVLT